MTALAAPRNSTDLGLGPVPCGHSFPQKGSTTCYHGGIAVLDAGYAKPGVTGLGLLAAGFFELEALSQANAGADGAKSVSVKPGTRKLANSAGDDAITQAHVGGPAFIVDDQTVACRSAGTRSFGGRIESVESDGVYVSVGFGLLLPSRADMGIQAISGTLVAGTCTIATGITVTAASRALVMPSAVITGSTNFASLVHLIASNVAGVPGVGTIIIRALGADGAQDVDAAGTFHGILIG